MIRKLCAVLLMMMIAASAQAERSRDEVRAAWRAIGDWHGGSPYAAQPSVTAPYAPGELDAAAKLDALNTLNFLRWLAGIDPVEASVIYDYQCQHGAVLLAALDYVDHNAPRPEDMDANFYDSAHLGTSSGNIARFNWMRDSIVREGVAYFVRDDGEQNLPLLGHRRWALNPLMHATGFGLANAESGMSYVVMYAHDMGRPDAPWDRVLWPAEGAFPAELMHDHLAWSAVFNPHIYDLEGSPLTVTLSEAQLGLSFHFSPNEGAGDGFCAVNLDGYGAGGCVIFRPELPEAFTDYQQNQRWHVRIDHLRTLDGGERAIEYTVDMIALRAVDAANIEISLTEAELRPGETLALTAAVIPDYADDLSVTWSSDDPDIASVDEYGAVTALAPGACRITCADCMGHTDVCALTVR